jgi:hypothetical protein
MLIRVLARFSCSAALTALFAATGYSSTIVITPGNPQGWSLQNQRGTGMGVIDGVYPRSGDGSIKLNTSASGDKADFENHSFTSSLSSVSGSTLGFDYYRNSVSTTSAALAPVMRLEFVKISGTTASFGNLIWESYYQTNPQGQAVAVDSWTHADTTSGFFWLKYAGMPAVAEYNRDLAFWLTDSRVGDVTIYGTDVGVGSGWTGTFAGAADNITFGGNTYNFETTAAPEPATWSLLGGSLLALAWRRQQTRRRAR